jgi:hypothetical protein
LNVSNVPPDFGVKDIVQESLAEFSLLPKWGLPQAHEDPAPAAGDDTGGASSSALMKLKPLFG